MPPRPCRSPELSVVLAVRNDEETIGHRVRAVVSHLRSLNLSFEVVAVNDGSRDNSFCILGLLQEQIPELRMLPRDVAGRAFLRGTAEARGAVVLLADGERTLPLAPLGWALGRLSAGREAVVLRGRYIVAKRLLALPIVVRTQGRGASFERAFERWATHLGVDVVGTRPARRMMPALFSPLARFLAI